MKKDFLFTVIVPCYNTEQYIEECIESVLGQSIGFLDTTQLILVDDGSDDGTLAMCKSYADAYPENVFLFQQDHGGASAARNLGLSHAKGEYVCFLDSDDKWDVEAFKCISAFFNENPLVNIAAARIAYFDGWNAPHALDHKFHATRVVNIFANPNNPQLSGTTSIFRRSILKGASFPPVAVSEDFAFVGKLILECGAFGIVREAVYYYRKRSDNSSTIDTRFRSLPFYKQTVEQVYVKLLEDSKKIYGYVIPYIQYAIMYDLQWRIIAKNDGFLSSGQLAEYRDSIASLLAEIPEKVICAQPRMNPWQKTYALALKYGKSYREMQSSLQLKWVATAKKLAIVTPSQTLVCYPTLTVEFLEMRGNVLHVEGRLNGPLSQAGLEIAAKTETARTPALSYFGRKDLEESVFFEGAFCRRTGFILDMKPGTRSTVLFQLKNKNICRAIEFGFGPFCKLTGNRVDAYFHQHGYYVISRPNSRLEVVKNASRVYGLKRELGFARGMFKRNGIASIPTIWLRWRTLIARHLRPNENIWLLSDRVDAAGDNGEAMFAFVSPKKNVKPYFAIAKSSPDFRRLRAMGRTVAFDSGKYLRLFLKSTCIVSSSFDPRVYRLNGLMHEYLKSLYDFKYVFLTHGITKDDFSRSLGRYTRNFDLFVASSAREAKSIVENEYYYGENQVALTGMPRFDLLEEAGSPQKLVVIAPTWRNNLVRGWDQAGETIVDEEGFRASEFFNRFASLLSNETLLAALRRHGYRLDFVLHPGFRKLAHLFPENDVVRVPAECDYRRAFREAAVWITDYSSVAFDFGFLKKPLAYYQFDEDDFFSGGHTYGKGYFDYRVDGFGPVVSDESQVVDFIAKQLEHKPMMAKEYADRVDSFFFAPPKGVSRRQLLFDKIMDLQKNAR